LPECAVSCDKDYVGFAVLTGVTVKGFIYLLRYNAV
jgi:hypothetical protein